MLPPDELYNLKFTGYFESMTKMYLKDTRFKTICDEYCSSIYNTKTYNRRIERNLQHKIKSENLSRELEEEILFYLVRNTE